MRVALSAFLTVAIWGICVQTATAQDIFSDDFESGSLANWTTSGSSPLVIDNTYSAVPAGGTYSAHATLSLNRMHRNIIADNGGTELSGASTLTAWIYDSTMTRPYVQALGYTGTGLPNGGTTADGTLVQLLAVGKYSSVTAPGETYDATKYQARVVSGSFAGWFNLNAAGAPSRSTGWHKFTIERLADDSTINFYVDDVLSRTIAGTTVQSWDTITMGFGTSSSSNGDAWYDGISVAVVPEPSVLALGLLGSLAFVLGRRHSSRSRGL